MDNDITTMRISRKTLKKFRERFREHPRETDEDIIIKLIEKQDLEK